MNIRKLKVLLYLPLAIIILSFIPKIVNLWIDFLWFTEVGYKGVFLKTLLLKSVISIGSFLITFIVISLTLSLRSKNKPKTKVIDNEDVIEIKPSGNKNNYSIIFAISFIVSLLFSLVVSTSLWDQLLLFLNQVPFGLSDPVFNKDLSFYTFNLNFYETIYSFVFYFSF
ncbi:Uncharacterised protein family (UPF0182) [Desulfonispora thiosulfatigenes DSM 11270]|uniref:Uncharacterized protein family (UPF0182) n=1 Tax=Desulfonispora thiosulfatigenes DSM 11270 TaxID=656914 RepID=A0A1W1VS19_DESTI|nr:Uncharacterised protein family (UPF0182) [Desulfonispora thiosulfatigenes DSM 11270]